MLSKFKKIKAKLFEISLMILSFLLGCTYLIEGIKGNGFAYVNSILFFMVSGLEFINYISKKKAKSKIQVTVKIENLDEVYESIDELQNKLNNLKINFKRKD